MLQMIKDLLCVRDFPEKSLNRLLLLLVLKASHWTHSVKEVLLKFLPISQENTFIGESF